MSWASVLEHFVFDRVLASAARSSSSVNPTATSVGAAATAAVLPILSTGLKDVAAGIDSHKSPLGIASVLVGDAETGIKVALDALIIGTVGQIPMAGGFLSEEAQKAANAVLDTQRDHFMTYLAARFGHASAVVAATPIQAAPSSASAMSDTGRAVPLGGGEGSGG